MFSVPFQAGASCERHLSRRLAKGNSRRCSGITNSFFLVGAGERDENKIVPSIKRLYNGLAVRTAWNRMARSGRGMGTRGGGEGEERFSDCSACIEEKTTAGSRDEELLTRIG